MMFGDKAKGAQFSSCRTYRYALWRTWGTACTNFHNHLMVIGLNPSTADEIEDDPTIRRCIRFAKDWGRSGLLMLNAFGYRSTDPKGLKAINDPNGTGNDQALIEYGTQAGMILAAWGVHCPIGREQQICQLINRQIFCLGKTKAGRPKHPLYIRADTSPIVFYDT